MNRRRVSVVTTKVWFGFSLWVLFICSFFFCLFWRGVVVRQVGKSSPCFLFDDSRTQFKNTDETLLCVWLSARDFWRNK